MSLSAKSARKSANHHDASKAKEIDTQLKEEEKIHTSSTPTPTMDETGEATTAEMKKKQTNLSPEGHKIVKMQDVLTACHKTKYLPLADGMYTGNVFFQPSEIIECKKNWLDVSMREVIVSGGFIEGYHTYSMEADDLLRMMYLSDMANNDHLDIERSSFEEWLVDIFSDVIKEDSHADFADRARLAQYLLIKNGKFSFGGGSKIQMFFQKRCIRDFTDVPSEMHLAGNNMSAFKTKSARGKFEYMIEMHIFCMEIEENEEVKMKKELEEGDVPSV